MKASRASQLRQVAAARLRQKPPLDAALPEEDMHKMLHELQVQQIELHMQNEMLREAVDAEALALHHYTELFDFAPLAYLSLDEHSKITRLNLCAASLLGPERLNLTGQLFSRYVTHEYQQIFSDFLVSVFKKDHRQNAEILVLVGKQLLWLNLEAGTGSNTSDCLIAIQDITERKQSQATLQRAASVFTHAHEGIMITDANAAITEVNATFCRATGYTAKEVLGKNPRILQSTHHCAEFFSEMWQQILTQGSWSGEIWNRRKNSEIFPGLLTISAVKNALGSVQHYVALFTDITPMKTYQRQLEHIAHYDMLTDLPNRVLLADRLSQAMVQAKRHHRTIAVAYMDLDGFKAINDTYGHNVGDELLITVSRRMQGTLREGDTLARIGGDEFIVVMVDLENIEDSKPLLTRLLKAAAAPVSIDDNIMQVSASVGVTFYPQDNVEADILMRHADQSMYVAKQAGKNRYQLFDTELDNAIQSQRKSIGDVRSALERNEFVLYYQPKVNMHTGKAIGVEALIRWQHPVHGLLPTLEFLPAIEGHAVSLILGEWVIDTALQQLSQWSSLQMTLPISVNLSAYQLQQANFTSRLATLLAAHPEVNPRSLELEILETSALSDIGKVSATMAACHELGVRFALDDFGTGYSSLTYLKRLPAYLIKIDQSFVHDMLEDADDLAIVKGVIGLAKAFQREVIAEGVETTAHGVALLRMGCQLAQGHGIARPMPSADVAQWVLNYTADAAWRAFDHH